MVYFKILGKFYGQFVIYLVFLYLSRNLNMIKNFIEKWLFINLYYFEILKIQNNGQYDKYIGIFFWQFFFIINVGNIINNLVDLGLK